MTKEPSTTKEWVKLEAAKLPHLTIGNITTFIFQDLPQMEQKLMITNTHAYPLFKAGHIQSILVPCKDNIFFYQVYNMLTGNEGRYSIIIITAI